MPCDYIAPYEIDECGYGDDKDSAIDDLLNNIYKKVNHNCEGEKCPERDHVCVAVNLNEEDIKNKCSIEVSRDKRTYKYKACYKGAATFQCRCFKQKRKR